MAKVEISCEEKETQVIYKWYVENPINEKGSGLLGSAYDSLWVKVIFIEKKLDRVESNISEGYRSGREWIQLMALVNERVEEIEKELANG